MPQVTLYAIWLQHLRFEEYYARRSNSEYIFVLLQALWEVRSCRNVRIADANFVTWTGDP